MFKSFMRNSVFALAAVAGLAATAPSAIARDFAEAEIYFSDGGRGEHRGFEGGRSIHRDILSGREIARALRYQGYADIREMDMRGDRYRVIAVRRNGAVVKLRVNAFTGDIMSEVRVGWVGPRHIGDRFPTGPRPHHGRGDGVIIEFGWSSIR